MAHKYIDILLTAVLWISFFGFLFSLFSPSLIRRIFKLQSFSRKTGVILFLIILIITALLGGMNEGYSRSNVSQKYEPDDLNVEEKYEQQNAIADCATWGEAKEYTECVLTIAKRNPKNINVCFEISKIDSELLQKYNNCLFTPEDRCNISLLDGDHMYWKGRQVYAQCLFMAFEDAGEGVCDNVDDLELKDSCLSTLAQKTNNPNLCNKLSTPRLTEEECRKGTSF